MSRQAAEPDLVRLAELTSTEAAARIGAGATVLLPLGSQEDQGPHAPMGDHLCADAIAVLIAQSACAAGNDTLVAPVLPFGGRDFFGRIPGGIALGQDTLRRVLADITTCLIRNGVRRMIVVNGHGGNAQAIHDVGQDILRAERLLVPSLHLWRIAASLLPELLGEAQAGRATGHGADPLCSVTMHLFGSLVRHDRIPPAPIAPSLCLGLARGQFGTASFKGTEIGLPLDAVPGGITGEARLSSAATGERITERLVAIGADLICHLVSARWGDAGVVP